MSATVKVFYERLDGQKEIRRFAINTSPGSDSFSAIKNKVKELYASLAHGNFQLFWQDSDGDRVAFSTTEELNEALGFVTDGVLRVYIPETKEKTQPSSQASPDKPKKPSDELPKQQQQQQQQQQQEQKNQSQRQPGSQGSNNGPFHPGVTCDGCEGPIYGIRFKCCVCPDFDLCGSCEAKAVHNEHDMYKINEPRVNPFSFLPPHLGRHIHRYMQMGANGGSASASASTGAGTESSSHTHSHSHSSSQDDYLNKMGANIAAFLDPFGIDVTYDVHNNGEHHRGGWTRCGKGQGRGCGFKSSGPWGPCPAWEEMEKRHATEKKQDKPSESGNDMETDVKSPGPSKSQDIHMEEENKKDNPVNKSPTGNSEDWTFVSEQEAHLGSANPDTPIPMPAPSVSAPSAPSPPIIPSPTIQSDSAPSGGSIYPNLRIQQSVDQMLAMGFTNTGNWLSDLLTQNDGDIGAVLDAIKVKATQQLDSLRGPQ